MSLIRYRIDPELKGTLAGRLQILRGSIEWGQSTWLGQAEADDAH